MQNKIRELYKSSQESQAAENMMGQNGQPLYPGLNYNNMTAAAMMSLGGAYAATQQATLQGRNPYTPATGYPGQVHPSMYASPYQVILSDWQPSKMKNKFVPYITITISFP